MPSQTWYFQLIGLRKGVIPKQNLHVKVLGFSIRHAISLIFSQIRSFVNFFLIFIIFIFRMIFIFLVKFHENGGSKGRLSVVEDAEDCKQWSHCGVMLLKEGRGR